MNEGKYEDEARQTNEGPWWYVWRCVESTELRGRDLRGLPKGRAPSDAPARAPLEPCGAPNIWAKKSPFVDAKRGENPPQNKCRKCGRRKRMRSGDLIVCKDEAHAFHVAAAIRRGEA